MSLFNLDVVRLNQIKIMVDFQMVIWYTCFVGRGKGNSDSVVRGNRNDPLCGVAKPTRKCNADTLPTFKRLFVSLLICYTQAPSSCV